MRRTLIIGFVLALSASFSLQVFAAASSIERGLKIGSSGEDVRLLQQILNQDSRTQIAATGPGSPANETGTFGALTRAAVIRFQELHSSELLTPVGLTRGTGFVGELTRAKLNAMARGAIDTTTPTIVSVLPAHVNPGDYVTVTGLGFSPSGNTLTLGGQTVGTASQDANQLVFAVPKAISGGLYAIEILSAEGVKSNVYKLRVSGATGATTSGGPIINQLSPSEGGYGAAVTILGSGFSPIANTVTFGFSTFVNLPSADGKTITFALPTQLDGLQFSAEDLTGLHPEFPLGVSVKNNAGESNIESFNFTFYN